MMQRCWGIWLFCVLIVPVWGQSPDLSNEPPLIAEMLEKAHGMITNKPDSAYIVASNALDIARRLNQSSSIGHAYQMMGLAEMSRGNWRKAEHVYFDALEAFQSDGDSLSVASIYSNLGYAFQAQGEYEKTLGLQLRALNLRQTYSDDPLVHARSVGAVGFVYQKLGDLDAAMDYFKQSLELRNSVPDAPLQGIAFSLKNIGQIHYLRGEYQYALVHQLRALSIFREVNNLQFVETLDRSVGATYFALDQPAKAEEYFSHAFEVAEQMKGEGIKGRSLVELGNLYLQQGNYDQAIKNLEESIGWLEQSGDLVYLETAFKLLSDSYEAKNDLQEALKYNRLASAAHDSIYNKTSSQQIAELRTEYETGQKEQRIALLEQKEQQRIRERNILLGGLLAAFVLVSLIIRANRRKKKAFDALFEQKSQTERLLQKLKDTQSHLVQSEKMASLGQLTAGIAHEINNPINFIASNVQALKMDFADMRPLLAELGKVLNGESDMKSLQTVFEAMDMAFLQDEIESLIGGIERGAERTQHIVAGLRTFSHSTGEAFEKADIHNGIDSTLVILKGKFKDRIEVQRDYGGIPMVSCQFDKLNQVFMNIITNAADAIEGEGIIYIQTRKEGDQVVICIKDTGGGMNEATRQRIFEPFYTTKPIGKGTGLGLSISYGIIEQHQGNIEVNSVLGKGTEFKISLPIEHQPQAQIS